jgi:branched-chain amino acid transport system permease protein
MMSLGGLVSFGHAAFFALGAYGAALSHIHWQWTLPAALACGVVIAALAGLLAGFAVARSAGVYLAMMSLALAQVVWASATQWAALTGGDNGVIGLRLVSVEQPQGFLLLVAALGLGSVALLGRISRSGMGWALQATRDAPLRAAASGLSVLAIRYRVFVVSAALAGLAGGLFAAHKGAVFPTAASVGTSVDVLLVVLLGGLHHRWGSVVGATVLVLVAAELGRDVEYWRGALGLVVMLLMVMAPAGVLGALGAWWQQRRACADPVMMERAP